MADVAHRAGAKVTRVEAQWGLPLDEEAMVATQVWSYPVDHYTIFLGDAMTLDDGGALVCAGGVLGPEPPADVVEVSAAPLAVARWRVSYGAESVVYRAKRISSFYPGQ